MGDGWVLDSIGNLVFQHILGFAIGFHQSPTLPQHFHVFQRNIGGHRINDLDLALLFTTIVRGHVWQSWLLEMDDAQMTFKYLGLAGVALTVLELEKQQKKGWKTELWRYKGSDVVIFL